MFEVFRIILPVAIMIGISLFSLNIEKQWNKTKNKEISAEEYLSADFQIFLLITMLCMIPIIPLSAIETNYAWLSVIIDSGLAMAISLFVLGKLSQKIYGFLAHFAKFRTFENESLVVYLIACVLYFIMLIKLEAYEVAFTFVSILLGRFVWFDTNKGKIRKEFVDFYHSLTVFPVSACVFFVLIMISVCVGDNILSGIVFWGHLIGLFIFYLKNKMFKKSGNKEAPT